MSELRTVREAVNRIYASYGKAKPHFRGQYDREIRHPEWTRKTLDRLDKPDFAAYNISVTGSKGKGSHSILLASMLQSIGYRVGLFTSPQLVDFMERFRVQGTRMPEETFLTLARQVLDITDAFEMPDGQYVGPVGILAALASLWFRDEKTEINVIECGRGALHDDVNQIRHQGALLTPVFMEHAEQLGPTLRDIGMEKAGVITPTTDWLVTLPQAEEVQTAVHQQIHRTRQGGSDAFRMDILDETFRMGLEQERDVVTVRVESASMSASVLLDAGYRPFAKNAAVALQAALRAVEALGWPNGAPKKELDGGLVMDLRDVQLPGRLQIVRHQPLTVVDGCIHASSARIVLEWLRHRLSQLPAHTRVAAIFGLPADKDGSGVMDTLGPHLDWCVFTRAHNPHLKFTDAWFHEAQQRGLKVFHAESIEEAAPLADGKLASTDILLVLGTQSFVGDSLVYYGGNSHSIWKSPS